MKNKGAVWLLGMGLCFVCFLGGFFLGRNLNHPRVQVSVPVVTTPAPGSPTTPAGPLLNINTATAEELAALPGIGQALAARIVAYREENGPFTSVNQLLLVEGIGEKKLSAIKGSITTGG